MDGTLGSQTALHARRLRRRDHERRASSPRSSARGARAGLARRRPRDRRPREPRGARRVRGDAGRSGSRSASASGSSTRSCLAPEDLARFAELGVAVLGPVLARAVRPRPRRALLGANDRRRLRVPLAARLGRARRERLGRARRGARPARRHPRRRPAHARRAARLAARSESLTVEQALHATTVAPAWLAGDERRRGRLLPGYLADLVVLDRDPVDDPRPRSSHEIAGRRHDGRRTLGAQPASLGLSPSPIRETPVRAMSLDAATIYTASMADSRTMLPVHETETCSVAACAEIVGVEVDRADRPRPLRGAAPLHRDRALLRRHQPAHARRAAALRSRPRASSSATATPSRPRGSSTS